MNAARSLRALILRNNNKGFVFNLSRRSSYCLAPKLNPIFNRASSPPFAGNVRNILRRAGAFAGYRNMATFNLSPVQEGREWDFVHQWSGDRWNCYWGEEAAAAYAFEPEIKALGCGLVTFPAAGEVSEDSKDVAEDLLRVYAGLAQDNVRCEACGSETDYPYVPILVPWQSAKPLTAEALLSAMGANDHIKGRVNILTPEGQNWGVDQTEDGGDWPLFEQHGPTVQQLLSKRGPPLVFYAGSEQLNPVPFFAVAQLSDSYAGGFMSALVHT